MEWNKLLEGEATPPHDIVGQMRKVEQYWLGQAHESFEEKEFEMIDSVTGRDLAPNGEPRVIVPLVGEDGNAFSIIGRCERAMRQAHWAKDEITAFRVKATRGDYSHLLATVMEYVTEPEKDEDEDEWNPYADDEEEE